jgi:uncharacterized membrane protein
MAVIRQTFEIEATPDEVFDLISHVEDFHQYTSLIKSITKTGPDTYHWEANISGLKLEWDVEVTKKIQPKEFAWCSTSGFKNCGSYSLRPSPAGTVVSFVMEYNISADMLEKAVTPLTGHFYHEVATGILTHIKERLEKEKSGYN